MKRFLLFCLSILLIAFLAACGEAETTTEEQTETDEAAVTTETAENNEAEQEDTDDPLEPTADTVCDSCNMKVYEKAHEFGVFTAQGITQDGEHVFFDDIGCLLNYERKNGEALAVEWIRDYETLEWTERNDSVPVKTNMESPMKWGYIMFADGERAESFAADEENSVYAPEVTDWTVVDEAANERFQKKMQAQQGKHSHDDHHEHMDH